MGNHYHLLEETPEGNLVAGMKWLQGAYTPVRQMKGKTGRELERMKKQLMQCNAQ
jgi:hypothetical protein